MSLKFTQLKPTTLGLDSVLDFGRHFGYTVSELLKDQPDYIRWLIKKGKKFHSTVYQAVPEYTLVSKEYYNNTKQYYRDEYDSDLLGDWFDDVPF